MSKRKAKEFDANSYNSRYVMTRILEMGGTPEQGTAFLQWYGEKRGYTQIQLNPFLAVNFGVNFEGIEKRNPNIPQADPCRVEGLCAAAFIQVQNTGSVCESVTDFVRRCHRIEGRAGIYENTPPLFIAAAVQKNFHIDGLNIYSRYLWRLEKQVSINLKKIQRTAAVTNSYNIEEIEALLEIEYDEGQRGAFEILKHPIGILTGGPGTGKTTILRGLIQAHEKTGRPLILCAPTGKAAQQMRVATGRPAQTIHKTLSITPYMEGGYIAKENAIPENALVIVDESSMLDIEIMECLVEAIAQAKAQVIFVGDADQLESVGAGSILRDLLASNRFFTVRLETIHRNAGTIAQNATHIKDGDWTRIKRDKSFITASLGSAEEIAQNALAIHQARYSPENPHAVKIYTPVKNSQYITSTDQINKSLHFLYHNNSPSLKIGDRLFSVGEPVVITKNDYALNILNGDEGIVRAITDRKTLIIEIAGDCVELSGAALQHVELAYAVTIHKAQGTSCEMAIILLPSKPACMVTRRLAYVAATRAERRVVFLHECYSLEMAIMDENTQQRHTGLAEKLRR